MPQMTLYAPAIHCEHCIATIHRTVDTVDGARWVSGDEDARSFVVDIERGATLDALASALVDEGYPLGEAPVEGSSGPAGPATEALFAPTYRVEASGAGAEVTYTCPCGSETEVFTYDRSVAEQAVDSCCDHHVLIEPNAEDRLRASLGDPQRYRIDVQQVEMPWGQPMVAAMAIPED